MWEGAGLYAVESLTGRTEDDLRNPPSVKGFTYVALRLITPWFNAPENPIARISGGPYPGGDEGGWNVSLKVEETAGLFLIKPTADNRGYYDLSEFGTFQVGEHGGYTNGLIFTMEAVSADELGKLVAGLAGPEFGDPCPYNEYPDYPGYDPRSAGALAPPGTFPPDASAADAGNLLDPPVQEAPSP